MQCFVFKASPPLKVRAWVPMSLLCFSLLVLIDAKWLPSSVALLLISSLCNVVFPISDVS